MKFICIVCSFIILSISAEIVNAQTVITFDDQGWNSDQILPSNFSIGNFSFSSDNHFCTNYGYNLDVYTISLYYVFQNTDSDKIVVRTNNGSMFDFISLDAFQVSETSGDSLVIEGLTNNKIVYAKAFASDTAWTKFNLNFNNINKIIIKLVSTGSGGLTDYNFDNFTFSKTVTDISNNLTNIPISYSLNQNYPNPFNPNTIIKYSIAKPGIVTLKVYDLLGREVSTLVNEFKSADTYTVNFNASKLSSGVYIYVLSSNGLVLSHKMILLK